MGNLSGFLELLKAPLIIFSQNGKLMAITATVYVIIYSVCYILYTFSANPFVVDLMLKVFALASARPGTPEYTQLLVTIREDIGIFFGIEAAYIVLYFFVVVFAQTTIYIIASCSYTGKNNLSLKELILKFSKTWTRPFITSFYVQLLAGGYTCFMFFPFLVPTLVLYDHRIVLLTLLIFLAIIFLAFYLYLLVVWNLAIVVSVVENTYGLSALGKARELVKGNRLNGFLLNCLTILIMSLVIFIFGYKLSPAMPIVFGVIQIICIMVVSMFQFMAYSGFYFQCKNHMAKSGVSGYSQISSEQVLDEDLP